MSQLNYKIVQNPQKMKEKGVRRTTRGELVEWGQKITKKPRKIAPSSRGHKSIITYIIKLYGSF